MVLGLILRIRTEKGALIELNLHDLDEKIIDSRLTQTLKDVSKVKAIFCDKFKDSSYCKVFGKNIS